MISSAGVDPTVGGDLYASAMPSAPAERGRRTLQWADAEIDRSVAFALAVAITVVVAVADYLTGPYLAFATVYLAPVALAGWFAGRRAALVIAGLASALGVLTTAADPGAIPAWINLVNGILRFLLYGFVGVVLAFERRAIRTIAGLASTDPLTGLANRRQFDQLAGRELTRARREQHPVAVVYIDVDDLKARNDLFGHSAGDAMLEAFAEVAGGALRSTDVLARLGGDEFAVFLPGVDGPAAGEAIERVRAALRAGVDSPITFSAGVVAGTVQDETTLDDLLRTADQAMFAAKTAGKDRTVTTDLGATPEP